MSKLTFTATFLAFAVIVAAPSVHAQQNTLQREGQTTGQFDRSQNNQQDRSGTRDNQGRPQSGTTVEQAIVQKLLSGKKVTSRSW